MNTKILLQGNFSRNKVICKYHKLSSRKIDPVIEDKAIQIWKSKVKEAKAAGKKIWDQPVYRLEKYRTAGNKCELEFSTISFSIRSSIKDFTEELVKKGGGYLPMAVYSSIFIEAADGNFVFGEKSDKYVANRKYSYIGGVFNRSDADKEVDLFAAALGEVKEELGVKQRDIKDARLLGALRSESCNVAMVFYCRLKLDRKEILAKFGQQNDNEMKNLFFARRRDLRDVGVNKIGKEPELVDIFTRGIDG